MSDRPYTLRSSGARYGAGDSSRAFTSNITSTPAAAARPTPRITRKIATPASRIAQASVAAPSPMKGGGIGNLTFEQREEIRDLFDTIDQQSRGYIPVSKLPDILHSLGLGRPAPEQWARWKLSVDPEGTGKLGYQQLEDFISLRYDEMDQKQEILNAFSLFKPDSRDIENAKITLADLKR
ncbi:Centrin-1, partial [Coemansia brasiliensis]